MKTKFICVNPISCSAKLNFDIDMNKFHSCRITKEDDNFYYLESLNKKYYFNISKNNDKNWSIMQ